MKGSIKKSALGEIEEEILRKELEENVGKGKCTLDAEKIKDKFIVTFTKSQREYLVDKDGTIKAYNGTVEIHVEEKTTNNVVFNYL